MALRLNQSHFVSPYLLSKNIVSCEMASPQIGQSQGNERQPNNSMQCWEQTRHGIRNTLSSKHCLELTSKTRDRPQTLRRESATNLPIVPYLKFKLGYLIWKSRSKISNESSVNFNTSYILIFIQYLKWPFFLSLWTKIWILLLCAVMKWLTMNSFVRLACSC